MISEFFATLDKAMNEAKHTTHAHIPPIVGII